MPRNERSGGKRPKKSTSRRKGLPEESKRAPRSRETDRSGGSAGATAQGKVTTPAEARWDRGIDETRPRASGRKPPPAPESTRASRVETGIDAELTGFFEDETAEEPEAGDRESREEPAAAFGAGRADPHEDLETDGPVLGGPGMIRMGGDRAVSSGTGGLAAGEDLDPVAEGDYWRENFRRSPYAAAEDETRYEPAYRFGWEKAGQREYRNRGFEEVELDLRRDWEVFRREPWEDAREAAREAWNARRPR